MCQSGEGEAEGNLFLAGRDSNFFGGIIAQIAAKDMETVVIQHQPGLLRFSYLNELLHKLSDMNVKYSSQCTIPKTAQSYSQVEIESGKWFEDLFYGDGSFKE